MILTDKNQSWQPPYGYHLADFRAKGAYLRAMYYKSLCKVEGSHTAHGSSTVVVYVNDQGREVARTEQTLWLPVPEPRAPVSRRHQFLEGWYLILSGLEEMSKCLR